MSIASNKKKKEKEKEKQPRKIYTYHVQKPFSVKEDFTPPKASQLHHVTSHPMPPLKSLIDASSIRGSPPSMGAGSHAWGSRNWLSAFSAPQLGAWIVFCCFVALWASSSLDGRGFPVSITSLSFCSLFFLGSTCSVLEGRVGWGARGRDLGGGGGSLGWEDFLASPLPGWLSNSSCRLL